MSDMLAFFTAAAERVQAEQDKPVKKAATRKPRKVRTIKPVTVQVQPPIKARIVAPESGSGEFTLTAAMKIADNEADGVGRGLPVGAPIN